MASARRSSIGARLVLLGAGYATARAGLRLARDTTRVNYRGRPVSLVAGPVLGLTATASAALGAAGAGRSDLARAMVVAGVTAGAVGRHDDLSSAPGVKGLRGHLGALRHGQVTTGVVKLVGLSAAGLVAASALPTRRTGLARVADVILGAGLIAGSANLVNLLDLRPGRALKAALVVSAPLLATNGGAAVAGPVGAALAVLPEDLGERVMLGDTGANALGAVLGVAAVARTGLAGRSLALAVVAALTVASERWSFTEVIDAHPVLRRWDRLGTKPR